MFIKGTTLAVISALRLIAITHFWRILSDTVIFHPFNVLIIIIIEFLISSSGQATGAMGSFYRCAELTVNRTFFTAA